MRTRCSLYITTLVAGLGLLAPPALAHQGPAPATRPTITPGMTSVTHPAHAEPYRPKYHFSPAKNWMNDPNGLVYYDGEYHLFFQYNPQDSVWGHMSWGHAVSRDLVHWKELPVAIPEGKDGMIFSGSAVMDLKNTSGFGRPGRPAMVAVYTMAAQDGSRQAQGIAYSLDKGRTFTKYSGNPVLDIGSKEFRDPKVQWYEPTKSWLMTVSNSTDHTVSFYSSPNLKDWKLLSKFGPKGAIGGVWECPDLFPLPVDGTGKRKWVLVVNINPGGVAGGSAAQYFVGDFDGRRFTADPTTRAGVAGADWVDHGADYYAAVSWDNMPTKDRVMIGWMNNWTYGQKTPTAPWRSAMSIPRRMGLATINGQTRLTQEPIADLNRLGGKEQVARGITVDGAKPLSMSGSSYALDVTFDVSQAERYGVKVRTGKDQATVIGYDAAAHQLYVDRSRSGAVDWAVDPATGENDFATVQRAPYRPEGGKVHLKILVDESSVEVFGGRGESVITDQIFPDPNAQGIELFSHGGPSTAEQISFTPLQSYRSTKHRTP